jgi:hypothetical protein
MRLSELQQALRAADPSAVLVAPRVLDRVIQRVAKLNNLFGEVPHRRCLVVERSVLYRHVDQDELDLEPDRLLPASVILLARPSPNTLNAQDRDTLLLAYWRYLFHASVHRELDRLLATGKLTPADVAERVARIGASEFAEVRMVLGQENYLLPGADDTAVYVEFAAVYLELRFFAANLVPIYFPSLADTERIDRLLARDLDGPVLFHRTRLPGAPGPVVRTDTKSDESHDYYWRLVRGADRAARAGNTVRAAIVRTKAARVAPAALTHSTREDARADLKHLTRRLQAALQLGDAEADEWLRLLPALLDKADQGNNPSEAALLFDLQKVGVDNEREIYALDVLEWLLSGGKRPIKRPLPSQRLVRITKHLRSAAQRLTQARLSDEERQHLDRLLQAALARCEERLRSYFRPVLTDALVSVGLQPGNAPERTAFAKMVEEMLDRITELGFFTFSDLRDAVSRNQLKMPDLADPHEFVRGDPLLRLDRRLSAALDGVYRPSEFYLRWLERVTSPAFGTAAGRWLTLFLILPFGGALLLLDGAQLLLKHYQVPAPLFGPIHSVVAYARGELPGTAPAPDTAAEGGAEGRAAPAPEPTPPAPYFSLGRHPPDPHRVLLLSLAQFLALSLFLLALVNNESFRRQCWQAVVLLWRLVRGLLIDLPVWVLTRSVVRELLDSWPVQLSVSFLLKPLAACSILWWVFPELFSTWLVAAITFLFANMVLNTRLARALGETVLQALIDLYELLRAGLLPGLLRLVVALFRHVIDTTEYVLHAVDEWLRFRSGDSQVSLVVRTVGTLLWYPITFLVRFYLVVLIEPGFNPLKAPVSYLAAKLMVPVYKVLTVEAVRTVEPLLGPVVAYFFVVPTVWLLPDLFGFLFWEMKENWRLYRANRRPLLRPVQAGPHGETVHQLLRPGFHSGTVPRLYARLRQAEREALQTGNWRAARTCWHSLQEVEKSLRRLVDRELVTLLQESPPWREQRPAVGRVALAPGRVRVELTHAGFPAEPAWLEWQEHGNRVVAGFPQPGWLARVGEERRQAVAAGLAGLYKLAGVDVVREQARANIPPAATAFDVIAHDLVLWVRPGQAPAVVYDLDTPKGPLPPRTPGGEPAAGWPPLDPARVLFARVPLTWQRWVAHWQGDAGGKAAPPLFSPAVQLLPPPAPESRPWLAAEPGGPAAPAGQDGLGPEDAGGQGDGQQGVAQGGPDHDGRRPGLGVAGEQVAGQQDRVEQGHHQERPLEAEVGDQAQHARHQGKEHQGDQVGLGLLEAAGEAGQGQEDGREEGREQQQQQEHVREDQR